MLRVVREYRHERGALTSFVCYPVMMILASKSQIWPCFAGGSGINRDRAVLSWLGELSCGLAGWQSQVHNTEGMLVAVRGFQLVRERGI